MSRSKTSLALFLCPLTSVALACGPFFPATVINCADAILAAPSVRHAATLAKISLPPAEFRAVPLAGEQSHAAQSLAAEQADLTAARVAADVIAAHLVRRRALLELDSARPDHPWPAELARTDGLPAEFALYHTATVALARGDIPAAIENWSRLLALPSAERPYKSTWAAHQLGRTATDPVEARRHFQHVRALARAGFTDTLGLAAASLGWEAKTWFDAADYAPAAHLYLAQLATGDTTAAHSLHFLALRVHALTDPATLDAFAADAALREVLTATLLAWREDTNTSSARAGSTARWLAALERTRAPTAPAGAPLALAAYRAAEFSACARWLALAPPDDATALWLRAKLALRAGRTDLAATALARLVRHADTTERELAALHVEEDPDFPPTPALSHIRAELAALKLAGRDYAEALRLLLRAGYWEDAAYVAERVLTVDELKAFVDTTATSLPSPPPRSLPEPDEPQPARDLRHLLARRLVRHHRLDEAHAYFPPTLAPIVAHLASQLRLGRDRAQPAPLRAAALMAAARIFRADGLALCGTELAPDFAIWGGDFATGLNLEERAQLPAHLRPSSDERVRASAQDTGRGQRFHYRYLAAELAWDATALMPDHSEATARALVEAGGWLKNRDPRAANRFYQALVRRCGATELGRRAAARHWFP